MSYKNSEVKGKVNEKLDDAMYDALKLCQAITKNSRTREVIMQKQSPIQKQQFAVILQNRCS